jgi:hypothetical protein
MIPNAAASATMIERTRAVTRCQVGATPVAAPAGRGEKAAGAGAAGGGGGAAGGGAGGGEAAGGGTGVGGRNGLRWRWRGLGGRNGLRGRRHRLGRRRRVRGRRLGPRCLGGRHRVRLRGGRRGARDDGLVARRDLAADDGLGHRRRALDDERGRAKGYLLAAQQSAGLGDPLAVHAGAVAGAEVGDLEATTGQLAQLEVLAGDLVVREQEVDVLAADGEPLARRLDGLARVRPCRDPKLHRSRA